MRLRLRLFYKIHGLGNKIFIEKNGVKKICKTRIKGLDIKIKGNNNTIIIEEPTNFKDCRINLCSHNNFIYIGTSKSITNLSILNRESTNGNSVHIGRNLYTTGNLSIFLYNNNTSLKIGNDVMFSSNVSILTGDGHKITDINNNTLNKKNYEINIGNHVWIGRGVTICKGARISNDTIVGTSSVVTRTFKNSNIIIAGNPARVIKTNTNWDISADF